MTLSNANLFFDGILPSKVERCTWINSFNSFYNKSNVLIGNWCEDRDKNENHQNDVWSFYDSTEPLPSATEYTENFKPIRHFMHETSQEDWDSKFKEEEERLSLLGRQEEYIKNMASSYDLQYRYCIKEKSSGEITDSRPDSCLNQGPNVDYSLSYGNPTQFGLQEYKKFLWQQEKNDEKFIRTTYQMSYGCPITNKENFNYEFGKHPEQDIIMVKNKRIYHGNAPSTKHNIQTYFPPIKPGRRGAYLRCGQL